MTASAALPGPVHASAPRGRAAEVYPLRSTNHVARMPNLRLVLRRVHGRAELLRVLDDKKPRPVCHHRNGASKTVNPLASSKEVDPRVEEYQGQGREAEPAADARLTHAQHVGEAGPGLPGAGERREEVTAAVDLAAAVHGALDVPDHDLPHRAVRVRDAVEGVATDADAQAAADIINGGGSPTTALSPEVRGLLTVIRDALDVPQPANRADGPKRELLLNTRLSLVLGTLDHLVADHRADAATSLGSLRRSLGSHPVNYPVHAEQVGEAGR